MQERTDNTESVRLETVDHDEDTVHSGIQAVHNCTFYWNLRSLGMAKGYSCTLGIFTLSLQFPLFHPETHLLCFASGKKNIRIKTMT